MSSNPNDKVLIVAYDGLSHELFRVQCSQGNLQQTKRALAEKLWAQSRQNVMHWEEFHE